MRVGLYRNPYSLYVGPCRSCSWCSLADEMTIWGFASLRWMLRVPLLLLCMRFLQRSFHLASVLARLPFCKYCYLFCRRKFNSSLNPHVDVFPISNVFPRYIFSTIPSTSLSLAVRFWLSLLWSSSQILTCMRCLQ